MNKNKTKKTILIVDDEKDLLLILKTLLESKGYNCLTAENSYECMEILSSRKPDLILMDIMLPEQSGYKICWDIKNNEKFSNIPIIFLSAKTDKSDKIMAEQMKGDDYIEKPFSHSDLVKKIEKYTCS